MPAGGEPPAVPENTIRAIRRPCREQVRSANDALAAWVALTMPTPVITATIGLPRISVR